ncbi:MAG: hypothetical protein ACKO6N_14410 [Myxococcota bacterium]
MAEEIGPVLVSSMTFLSKSPRCLLPRLRSWPFLWLALTACDPFSQSGDCVQPKGSGDDPQQDGPFAVGMLDRVLIRRFFLSDVPLSFYYPAQEDGQVEPLASPMPILILLPDDWSSRDDFEWLGLRLASWGWAVAVVESPYRLSGLSVLRVSTLLDRLEDTDLSTGFLGGQLALDSVVIGGVGGGAGTAWQESWLESRIGAAFFLHGAPWVPWEARQLPALMLTGSSACFHDPVRLEGAFASWPGQRTQVRLDGLTVEQLKDVEANWHLCTTSLDDEVAHDLVSGVLVSWLEELLRSELLRSELLRSIPSR